MILVAVLAFASLLGRTLRERWLRQRYRNPVSSNSQLSASLGNKLECDYVAGRPVPVRIHYDVLFNGQKLDTGSTALVMGSVWLEDSSTGLYVDGYTFDAPLTTGERERVSGEILWETTIPHPGHYLLRSHLLHVTPSGELMGLGGRGTGYRFIKRKK